VYPQGNHSGRSSRESSKAEQHLLVKTQIAAGLRASGLEADEIGRFYCMPLPEPPFRLTLSAVGMVRSQLPLRGSSGFAPDSLLVLAFGPGTAMDHKILCFCDSVNEWHRT
jgi:hypothetical protein